MCLIGFASCNNLNESTLCFLSKSCVKASYVNFYVKAFDKTGKIQKPQQNCVDCFGDWICPWIFYPCVSLTKVCLYTNCSLYLACRRKSSSESKKELASYNIWMWKAREIKNWLHHLFDFELCFQKCPVCSKQLLKKGSTTPIKIEKSTMKRLQWILRISRLHLFSLCSLSKKK